MTSKALKISFALGLALCAQLAEARRETTFLSGQASYQYDYVFYNGVGKPVGGKTYLCNGAVVEWGKTGVFQDVSKTPCE
ncbi:MAG: hypothetical protein ABJA62_11145 [Luteimonas sp.]